MKKVNVKNIRLKDKAKELSKNRSDRHAKLLNSYLHNYDVTQVPSIKLVHFVLENKAPKEVLQFAISNYYINLVSIWETFFRDLFVFTLNIDENFKLSIANKFSKNGSEKSVDNEILSLAANFQNLTDIGDTFYPLLENTDILDYIGSYEQDVFMPPNFIEKFTLNEEVDGWARIVREVFDLRHKFIHDSNYIHEFAIKDTSRVEWLFNLVPKLFANILADKYELDRFSVEKEKENLKFFNGRGKFNLILGVDEIVNFDNCFIKDLMVKVAE